MNFFGHATVASWVSNAPAVVLGAMLPDFATMIRARPPTAKQPELWRGVRLHHDTDAVFHDHPVFRELCADAVAALSELGLARGPARATAHVGVEIHIDGVLARDDSARKSYLDALGAAPALAAKLDWRAAEESARFDRVSPRVSRAAPSRSSGFSSHSDSPSRCSRGASCQWLL